MMMSMSRGLLAQIQAGKMQPKTGSLAVAGSAVSGQPGCSWQCSEQPGCSWQCSEWAARL